MPMIDGIVYDRDDLIARIAKRIRTMVAPETLHIEAKDGKLYVFTIGPENSVHLQGAKCLFTYEFDRDEELEIKATALGEGETTPESIAENIVSFLESQQRQEAM